MPGRYQLADIQPEQPPRKSVGVYSFADVDAAAPAKKQPTFASRFLDNTVKPIEAVSDSIQSAMRSQNPIGSLVEATGDGLKNAAKQAYDTGGKSLIQPLIDVGSDALEGNLGAAAGGLTGLALPFLPKVVKGAAKIAPTVAAVTGDAARGALKGAAAPTTLPTVSVRGVPITVESQMPASVSQGIGGAVLGHQVAGTPGAVAGGVIGAAYPIVKGAVQGVREGLAARALPAVVPKSKRVRTRPMTKASRAAEEAQTADAPPVEPTPMAAKPLPQPDNGARVSVKPEPGSPMERLSPEKLAEHEALAAEYNTPPATKPTPLGADYPARNWLAGKQAEKAMNFAHEFDRVGIPVADLANISEGQWGDVTGYINGLRDSEWKAGGSKGRAPKAHAVPSAEVRNQIAQILQEIEARKVAPSDVMSLDSPPMPTREIIPQPIVAPSVEIVRPLSPAPLPEAPAVQAQSIPTPPTRPMTLGERKPLAPANGRALPSESLPDLSHISPDSTKARIAEIEAEFAAKQKTLDTRTGGTWKEQEARGAKAEQVIDEKFAALQKELDSTRAAIDGARAALIKRYGDIQTAVKQPEFDAIMGPLNAARDLIKSKI